MPGLAPLPRGRGLDADHWLLWSSLASTSSAFRSASRGAYSNSSQERFRRSVWSAMETRTFQTSDLAVQKRQILDHSECLEIGPDTDPKSLNNSLMRFGMCDSGSVEPFRRIVEGPLEPEELIPVELFLRTVVLHDAMWMLPEDEWLSQDEADSLGLPTIPNQGGYTVLLRPPESDGFGLFEKYSGGFGLSNLKPESGQLTEVFKKRYIMVGALSSLEPRPSTLLFSDPVFAKMTARAERFPAALFDHIDASWAQYARDLSDNSVDLRIPPVLGIVLTRCARRDAIPAVIKDLREEWQSARRKVWDLLDALKAARTLREAIEIHLHLSEASSFFAPEPTEHDSRPIRVLWEIVAAATMGAGIVGLSGGKPVVGAITGAMAQVPRSVPALLHEFGPAVFGRGAFDLARRVRRAVSDVELGALSRLLSDAEKQKLGFR